MLTKNVYSTSRHATAATTITTLPTTATKKVHDNFITAKTFRKRALAYLTVLLNLPVHVLATILRTACLGGTATAVAVVVAGAVEVVSSTSLSPLSASVVVVLSPVPVAVAVVAVLVLVLVVVVVSPP